MPTKTWILDEPSIEEVLADPIIQLLMRRDGVDRQELRARLRRLGDVEREDESKERSLVA